MFECLKQVGILFSIIQVESNFNPNAIGDNGKAVGILQIHPIMVEDVNRIAKTNYNLEDRYCPQKSSQMFFIYTNHYTPDWNFEKVAKRWNGGPRGDRKEATEKYWQRILDVN